MTLEGRVKKSGSGSDNLSIAISGKQLQLECVDNHERTANGRVVIVSVLEGEMQETLCLFKERSDLFWCAFAKDAIEAGADGLDGESKGVLDHVKVDYVGWGF